MDFGGAKAVWINNLPQKNEYATFRQEFFSYGNSSKLYVCSETDYIAYINGNLVSFNQFSGYKNIKYFDCVDISEYCVNGKNTVEVTVRYEGVNSAVRIDCGAWLIFCVEDALKNILCKSGDETLGAIHPGYIQHSGHMITPQLGLSCGMKFEEGIDYSSCKIIDIEYNFLPRPVQQCEIIGTVKPKKVISKNLYDFERELSGYVHLKLICKKKCCITLVYGEHVADGDIRYIIGNRDFSLKFECKEGINEFTQLFLRIGARYIKLFSNDEFDVDTLEILEYQYPIKAKKCQLVGIDREIYDTCVRTLRLCMHNHYEDCPWREQALYVLDSRNQMLCGYFAFDKYEFARANIVFMSKGLREDNLLELTFPAINTPSIPFFSIMYPVLVWEYVCFTGDKSIIDEVMETMLGIMNNMKKRIDENGLILNLSKPYWNFYEWSTGSDGMGEYAENSYDLILNCAYLYSYEKFKELCRISGNDFSINDKDMRKSVFDMFYNKEKGLVTSH